MSPAHAAPTTDLVRLVARRRTFAATGAALALCLPMGALMSSGTAYAADATTNASASDSATVTMGANATGPYNATPSTGDNQGNGNAPANGTVGKADDKNPPGQLPGGSDANNGYECDDNNGVGDNGGNPAHTGCTTTTTTPTTTPTGTSDSGTVGMTPKPPVPPKTPVTPDVPRTVVTTAGTPATAPVVTLGGGTVVLAPASVPVASVPADALPITGVVEEAFSAPQPLTARVAQPVAAGTASPAALPFTGSDTETLVLMSALLLAAGGAMVRAGRPQARHAVS